jgi:hypothetical protein
MIMRFRELGGLFFRAYLQNPQDDMGLVLQYGRAIR